VLKRLDKFEKLLTNESLNPFLEKQSDTPRNLPQIGELSKTKIRKNGNTYYEKVCFISDFIE
jgi:hypothetical protein